MRAVATLLLDSLRLLRARALFWVTLAISTMVGVIYLSIGFTDTGMSMMFGLASFDHELLRKGGELSELLYIGLFNKFIVGLWLSWVAVILGLVSCASIYPDFMAEGSIGLSLSKPVRRVTVFFTKYLGSLLFMFIQVTIFTLLVFFALRWRIGSWNPSIFVVIPLTVLVFSFLYSVVVLVTVKTRSTLAGVLVAMLVWLGSFVLNLGDEVFYTYGYPTTPEEEMYEDEIVMRDNLRRWHKANLAVYALLPKTKQTMELADRWIVIGGEKGFSNKNFTDLLVPDGFGEVDKGVDEAIRRNSVGYVLGTSLAFEAVMLSLAAWIFCRRDF